MKNQSTEQMWQDYTKEHQNTSKDYVAWPFGGSKEMANELANLVLEGKKTATASNYKLYEIEKEPLPEIGLHNIILNGNGEAVAIVETTAVEVIPFNEVTEEHAYLEGEGDRSLAYWRDVHETFFKREFKEIKQEFHSNIPVVCERFKVVFTK
ncbi:ASCH domain-containing protein [Cytobacillus purgationiresistens]|uniref:Uncharacterized protein YhfF n=1 Tax=Cytobacillus purgationiresistens TaxID=863449 RepID=A0ABU0APG2_9BACI|nr:ASCH domain-containing protein [Cytobacillus purgationiresistens]MDQ0273179.1 uncharacterized protein YhfF [Cytobacillus purgationiresistens]